MSVQIPVDSATIQHLIRQIPEGQETIFDFVGEGGESVKKVEVSRRVLQPEVPELPVEMPIARAKKRCHTFNDIDTFADYLIREASADRSIILADVDRREIIAVLDETNPLDREQVRLKAIEHPLFTPWSEVIQESIPVLDFALFIMQHRRAVTDPDGRELALLFSQVKMSKAITVMSGVGKKSINGIIAEVEIQGERKGMPMELPETITVNLPLFVGTSPQEIEIDLLVTNRGESVVVYATAADVEQQRIVAFEEMVTKLKAKTGHLVGLGSIAEKNWETLRR